MCGIHHSRCAGIVTIEMITKVMKHWSAPSDPSDLGPSQHKFGASFINILHSYSINDLHTYEQCIMVLCTLHCTLARRFSTSILREDLSK